MELNFSMPLVALEELLHVSGIFEPEKMVHHELMDLEMQVRPATSLGRRRCIVHLDCVVAGWLCC